MLFERDQNGMLHQVAPEEKGTRRHHTIQGQIMVLFTPEEEAARDQEEVASNAAAAAREDERRQKLAAIEEKLGVSAAELKQLLGS